MKDTTQQTDNSTLTMASDLYKIPEGLYQIPDNLLDLRSDAEVDNDLLNPKPVGDSDKNIWFFWHSGFQNMHPYTQRNVRAWHRRFSKQGWVIRVMNRDPASKLNIDKFLDIHDEGTFPKAFVDGTIGGDYAPQHTSDLVRWPLLLKYGGVYADVGMMQIGDLDRLWEEKIANPDTPFEVLSYNSMIMGAAVAGLTNYFLAAPRNNPLFERAHKLFLALWAEDGGKSGTEGMHASPLLEGVPHLIGASSEFTDNGVTYSKEECAKMLTDYIIQGQALTMAMSIVDEEDNWDGPAYTRKHVYGLDFANGSQLINFMTAWNGPRQFELLSLPIAKQGEEESADQKQAREIVEACLQKSWGFKLAHGIIIKVLGPTLGSLWRDNQGSDAVPGTYADWLRHGMVYWNQKDLPGIVGFDEAPVVKRGPLLRAVQDTWLDDTRHD